MDLLLNLDYVLFRAINLKTQPVWLDFLMLVVSSHTMWICLAFGVVIFSLWKRRLQFLKSLAFIALAIAVSDLVTFQLLKPAFSRPRPCHQQIEFRLVQASCGGDWGFPSNHAANSGAVSIAVFLLYRKRWLTFLALSSAALVSFSRIYLGVHFPGDVLVGFAVGGCCSFLLQGLLRLGTFKRLSEN